MAEQINNISNPSPEDLRLDYQQTCEQFRLLADIRFKLLAFVPILAGAAITLLSSDKVAKDSALVVGILGFFVTVGIIIYDLRNSQFYSSAIARARFLEAELHLPKYHLPRIGYGGIFTERPGRPHFKLFPKVQKLTQNQFENDKSLTKITLWHDRGLALVYSASLGGWIFIIINSASLLLGLDNIKISGITSLSVIISVPLAIIGSILTFKTYIKISNSLD